MTNELQTLGTTIWMLAKAQGIKIVTAESCTGGMIASTLTDIPGSSDVFDRGFITYSNSSKWEVLGVPMEHIEKYGAVSAEVAEAMVEGALQVAHAHLAVSVTGIAGPSGGSNEKPVGLTYIGLKQIGKKPAVHRFEFKGNGRAENRQLATKEALELVLKAITKMAG